MRMDGNDDEIQELRQAKRRKETRQYRKEKGARWNLWQVRWRKEQDEERRKMSGERGRNRKGCDGGDVTYRRTRSAVHGQGGGTAEGGGGYERQEERT